MLNQLIILGSCPLALNMARAMEGRRAVACLVVEPAKPVPDHNTLMDCVKPVNSFIFKKDYTYPEPKHYSFNKTRRRKW